MWRVCALVRFQDDSFGLGRQHPNFRPVDGDERFVGSVDFVGRDSGKVAIDLVGKVESGRVKAGGEARLTDQPPDRRVTLLAKVWVAACG